MKILSGLGNRPAAQATVTAEISGYTKYQGRDAIIVKNVTTNQTMIMVQGKAKNEEAELKRYKISTISDPQSKNYIAPKDNGVVVFESVVERKDGTTLIGEFSYMTPLYFGKHDEARTFGIFYARPLPQAKDQKIARVEILLVDKEIKAKSWDEFYKGMFECYRNILATENGYRVGEKSVPLIYLTDDEHSQPHGIYINNVEIDGGSAYRRPNINEFKEQLKKDETVLYIREQFQKNTSSEISVDMIPALKIGVPEAVHQRPKYQNVIKWHKGMFKVDVGGDSATLAEKERIGFRNNVIGFWNGWVTEIKPADFSQPRLNQYENSAAIKKGATSVAESRTSAATAAAAAAAAFDTASMGEKTNSLDVQNNSVREESFQEHLNNSNESVVIQAQPHGLDGTIPFHEEQLSEIDPDFLFGEEAFEPNEEPSGNVFMNM